MQGARRRHTCVYGNGGVPGSEATTGDEQRRSAGWIGERNLSKSL
jgi:hypothetical protein